MRKIKFWRLQEVEVPIFVTVTDDELKNVIEEINQNEDSGWFDYDICDWDNEEVVNEDYSGSTENFQLTGVVNKNYYCPFDYTDQYTRNAQNQTIAYLSSLIDRDAKNKHIY